jgi:hypothetical protein
MIVPAASITQMLVVFTDTSKPTKNSIAGLPDPLGWIGGA